MLRNILKLTKHSAIYGIGHILGRTIGFLLLPLHTNFIPPEDYALYVYGYALIPIIAIFYSAGINSAQLKFLLTSPETRERKSVLATSFSGTLLIGLVLSAVLFAFSGQISESVFGTPKNIHLVHASICILFFDSLSLIFYNVLRAVEKSISFVMVSIINIFINISLNYIMIVRLGRGITGIFMANLWASIATLILLLFINRSSLSIKFSFPVFKKLIVFGLPLVPSTLAMVVLTVIDRFIIKDILGDKAAGIYGAGYKLGMFMSLVITAFRYAWYPFYLTTASTEKNAPKIFSKVFTYFVFVCSALFLLLSIFIKDITRLELFGFTIFGKAYWESIVIVPTILASYVFYGLHLNFQIGLYLENKTPKLAVLTVCSALINIILNYLLIPSMGIFGAAITTLVSYAFLAIATYFTSRRFYRIDYEWKKVLLLSVLCTTLYFISRIELFDTSILLKTMLFISYFVILLVSGFFEKKEISSVSKLLRERVWHH